jgi:hypothetical protein
MSRLESLAPGPLAACQWPQCHRTPGPVTNSDSDDTVTGLVTVALTAFCVFRLAADYLARAVCGELSSAMFSCKVNCALTATGSELQS